MFKHLTRLIIDQTFRPFNLTVLQLTRCAHSFAFCVVCYPLICEMIQKKEEKRRIKDSLTDSDTISEPWSNRIDICSMYFIACLWLFFACTTIFGYFVPDVIVVCTRALVLYILKCRCLFAASGHFCNWHVSSFQCTDLSKHR